MIESLQGLRVLGMLGIFLFHSGLLIKGTFPVTFFFMLSGFVLYYSYSNKIESITFKENLYWVKKRMIKLYPIHIITFIMSIFIRWNWVVKFDTSEIFIKAILNISLLQSLASKQTFPFNGLSWFLSTTFILYIVAMPLILLIKNTKNIRPLYIILGILIIQYIINKKGIYGINIYTSPCYRVFEFAIGMLVAKLFIYNKEKVIDFKNYSAYEIFIVILFFIMYFVSLFINVSLVYYSPIFILGMYILSFEKGVVSRLLSMDIFQKLSIISFEFYMVHELILIVFRNIFAKLQYYWLIKNIIISVPAFIISITLAIILNKYITNNMKLWNINKKRVAKNRI